MIKRSALTYFLGFFTGAVVSAILLKIFPSIYQAFIGILAKKIQIQRQLIPNLPLMLITNNILASLICAFGGYGISKVYLHRNANSSRLYYLTLYIFPIFILFTSGFVLGAFFTPFIGDLAKFFNLLFPHGIFELPAVILSGSIGFDIGEGSIRSLYDIEVFRDDIDQIAKGKVGEYKAVIALIVIGGLLEGVGL
ncbi:MAG: stage II sporulation protein M [Candidatus Hydrothermarchaeales archaeon]